MVRFFKERPVSKTVVLVFVLSNLIISKQGTHLMMGHLSYQSRLIPFDEARQTGCFTTLPLRIHPRDDLADAASRQFVKDWAREMRDGREQHTYFSFSPVGNWSSLIYPEAIPERLGVLAYLSDLGLIHDGIYAFSPYV